jgi:NADH-quinone oxidoreductase subunit M
MIAVLLILIPLLGGLASFFMKGGGARNWSLLVAILTLAVFVGGVFFAGKPAWLSVDATWLPELGSNFAVSLDGMAQLLCLLTAMAFPLIFVATWNKDYKDEHSFFGLMLLSQAGLMGVFLAQDLLLFYFFWELALIPVYFLCSKWGGERRIQVTFKFFIYTFIGSLLMLVGIIYLYLQTKHHSFSMISIYNVNLSGNTQSWVFWLFFVAFAIKMPIFPFHTWQPDTYEQSPTAVTMVLSGIMVKMGVFAVLRWLIPITPLGTWSWGDTVSSLCVTGIVYASVIAIRQDDIKRLIAYSSIAHIGLMAAAIFSYHRSGIEGANIQMFSHGMNIIGLWIVAELIERKTGTRKLSELGGIAQKAPVLAILFVIIALANIALPLTNSFVGEFMMFNGMYNSTISRYSFIFAVVAGISIILAAVYTLRMLRKALYGSTSARTEGITDIATHEKIVLSVIVVLIFITGVFPKPMLQLTQDTVTSLMNILKNNFY